MDKTGLIYVHINKINGAAYVGQTVTSLNERAGFNGANYKGCPLFYRAITKYGWDNFEHVILENDIPLDKIDERETYWINKYHSFVGDPEYKSGYNVTDGGQGSHGVPCSEEKKEKISKANTGKVRTEEMLKTLSESHKGKKQTEETKQKRKDKLTGQKRTDEQRKHYSESFSKTRAVRVKCVETDQIFESYQAAAEWLGCSKQIVQNNISDPVGHKTAKGYHFVKVDNT